MDLYWVWIKVTGVAVTEQRDGDDADTQPQEMAREVTEPAKLGSSRWEPQREKRRGASLLVCPLDS